MKKNIIKVLSFIFIFLILFYCVTKILWNVHSPITYFYKEPKDSIDIVYIGSSNAYAHFNSVLAYNLYGYTTGFFSTDSQYFGLVKSGLEEVEKYQKPSLYIIDIAKIANEIDDFTEQELRFTIDSMKISKNRIDTINEVLANKKVDKDDYINYY